MRVPNGLQPPAMRGRSWLLRTELLSHCQLVTKLSLTNSPWNGRCDTSLSFTSPSTWAVGDNLQERVNWSLVTAATFAPNLHPCASDRASVACIEGASDRKDSSFVTSRVIHRASRHKADVNLFLVPEFPLTTRSKWLACPRSSWLALSARVPLAASGKRM